MVRKILLALALCMPSMAHAQDAFTPNIGLDLPPVGSLNWAPKLNNNSTLIDAAFGTTCRATGCTLTGTLVVSTNIVVTGPSNFIGLMTGTTAQFSGYVSASSFTTPGDVLAGEIIAIATTGGPGPEFALVDHITLATYWSVNSTSMTLNEPAFFAGSDANGNAVTFGTTTALGPSTPQTVTVLSPPGGVAYAAVQFSTTGAPLSPGGGVGYGRGRPGDGNLPPHDDGYWRTCLFSPVNAQSSALEHSLCLNNDLRITESWGNGL